MRGRSSVLVALLAVGWGCTSGTAPSTSPTPTATPTPAVASALALSGPARIAEGACGEYTIAVVDEEGKAFSVVDDVTTTVTAGGTGSVFSDAGCVSQATGVTVASGNASANVYIQALQAGPMIVDATDDADTLAPGQLTISIDAILLADQDFSSLATGFTNAAWYTIESSAGVTMQAQVTVPPTGDWYIEVHGRAVLFDGTNNATMARLREIGPAAPATVDTDMINLVNGATASAKMVWINPAPLNGMTYVYQVQVSTITANQSIVNPAQFTFGPAGDQIATSQSMVMAVVRPSRYEVTE